MPIYHPFGEQLVPHQEFLARSTEIREQQSFGVGTVGAGTGVRPFVDIDFGKPLSVMIRHIYTGRFPEKHVFSSRKPMLISSAVKDITTTSAGAQAVNILKDAVAPGTVLRGPSALEDGTALVYYSPAAASPLVSVSLQMVFENFDKELFSHASQLFGNLAGVPIFVPASGYLLGASTVLKLAGDLGDSLLNGQPVLSETMQFDFAFGGGTIPQPGFWVLSSGAPDLSNYRYDSVNGLVHKSNNAQYDGGDPVIVVSVDGQEQKALANFTPLMASASLLGKFYNQKPGSEAAMDTLLGAVKLFNDLTFRKKAEDLKQQIAALPAGSADIKKLQSQIDALNANIGESRLRLSDAGQSANA